MLLTDIEIGWIAGFVDGEGCFGISKHHCYVEVVNTKEDPIRFLYERFGGSLRFALRPDNSRQKPCWRWCVSGKEALIFTKVISEHLKVKKPQSELLLKYTVSISGKKLSKDIRDSRESIKSQMALLNKRGLLV